MTGSLTVLHTRILHHWYSKCHCSKSNSMHWYKESGQQVGSLEVVQESRLEEYF